MNEHLEFTEDTPVDVLKTVARCTGISVDRMQSPIRTEPIANARQLAMFILRVHVRRDGNALSYPVIGGLFGNRDHGTCIHAVRRVRERFDIRDRPTVNAYETACLSLGVMPITAVSA